MNIIIEIDDLFKETRYGCTDVSIYREYQETIAKIALLTKDTYDKVVLEIRNPQDIEEIKTRINDIVKMS